MRPLAGSLVAASVAYAASAAATTLRNEPLRFREDGTFKIVEVSDVHFTRNAACNDLSPAQQRFPCSDANGTAFWRTLVAEEDPDLFVFTGDSVCGGDAAGGADAIEGLLADWAPGGANAHVPWIAVEGNHDGESGLDYAGVAAKFVELAQAYGNGLNGANAQFLGADVYGNTNFFYQVLGPVSSNDTATTPLLSLYFVDSNSYATNAAAGGGYGWVHLDQINWLANTSSGVRAAAAAGGYDVPPALAYQHIPLPEYAAWVAQGGAIVGQWHEGVSPPNVDTGVLARYMEAGDVKAVTVGHDHTNDFCTATPVNGVYLCYDGHGSYGASGYGEPNWPIRARIWHVSRFGGVIQTYKRLDTLAGGAFPPGNASAIDLQTIYAAGLPLSGVATSQTSGNPDCPPGYSVVDIDLNHEAGGTYSYVCIEHSDVAAGGADNDTVVLNVSVAFAPAGQTPACPQGWQRSPGNMKAGTKASVAENLCALLGVPAPDQPVAADLTVVQGAGSVCPGGYAQATPDLSGGVGVFEVICVKYLPWEQASAALRGSGGPHARMPTHWQWSGHRPADKAPRAQLPARLKPLGMGPDAQQLQAARAEL